MNSKVLKIRTPVHGDMEFIYKLANDPLVRSTALNSEPIPWETHYKWFSDRLSGNLPFFIITLDGNECGYVRFNIDDGVAIVSIALGEEYRGVGAGSRGLVMSVEEAIARPDVHTIEAVVLLDNDSSQKMFAKCGFKITKQTKINDKDVFIFTYDKTNDKETF